MLLIDVANGLKLRQKRTTKRKITTPGSLNNTYTDNLCSLTLSRLWLLKRYSTELKRGKVLKFEIWRSFLNHIAVLSLREEVSKRLHQDQWFWSDVSFTFPGYFQSSMTFWVMCPDLIQTRSQDSARFTLGSESVKYSWIPQSRHSSREDLLSPCFWVGLFDFLFAPPSPFLHLLNSELNYCKLCEHCWLI